MARRAWALLALALLAGAAGLAVALAVSRFPRGLTVLACLVALGWFGWYGVRRRGTAQLIGLVGAGLSLAAAVVFIVVEGRVLLDAVIAACVLGSMAAARRVFTLHVHLPPAPPPKHPVLFYNPKSGDGKAERFNLASEASDRGMEAVELKRGDDLRQLVRDAIARGADGLAMAGGDGSQAIVAAMAAEEGLPYACIPAGTRNHFALDLGVDRDDVVGALDAFISGGERIVDLAEVNGQVFVNNVSLGLYAKAVQRDGYREAKIRTLLRTVPDVLGPDRDPPELTWDGQAGTPESGAALLVSNNPYRLGPGMSSGTRPHLDRGLLGVAVFAPERTDDDDEQGKVGLRQWTTGSFDVDSASPVPSGVDGEAMTFDPPLRFRVRPAALRVRIAPQHPGASPSAILPEFPAQIVGALLRHAFGRSPDAGVTRSG